jgi:hypothetical protein
LIHDTAIEQKEPSIKRDTDTRRKETHKTPFRLS